jgi:hypothetical protein
MVSLVRGNLGWLPSSTLQHAGVFQSVYLDLQRPAALDHLLFAVFSKSPKGKITSRAGAYK